MRLAGAGDKELARGRIFCRAIPIDGIVLELHIGARLNIRRRVIDKGPISSNFKGPIFGVHCDPFRIYDGNGSRIICQNSRGPWDLFCNSALSGIQLPRRNQGQVAEDREAKYIIRIATTIQLLEKLLCIFSLQMKNYLHQ